MGLQELGVGRLSVFISKACLRTLFLDISADCIQFVFLLFRDVSFESVFLVVEVVQIVCL
jgi:hypothetical protein